MKCELCGIEVVDNTFRYSYKPLQPVHKDKVYTQVCRVGLETQKLRDEHKEDDLESIALEKCINTTGKYDPRYRWDYSIL